MCGALCACCGLCCRVDKQLDACCVCIPLRVGALSAAALYILIDAVLVVLFTMRYFDDPFKNTGKDAGSGDAVWAQVLQRLVILVAYAQPSIIALVTFFAVWWCVDVLLLVAAVMEWQLALRIWVLLSLFRILHIVVDTFLILITFIWLEDAVRYLIPNFVALASLIPLAYIRCVVASYARDIKVRKQIRRDADRERSADKRRSASAPSSRRATDDNPEYKRTDYPRSFESTRPQEHSEKQREAYRQDIRNTRSRPTSNIHDARRAAPELENAREDAGEGNDSPGAEQWKSRPASQALDRQLSYILFESQPRSASPRAQNAVVAHAVAVAPRRSPVASGRHQTSDAATRASAVRQQMAHRETSGGAHEQRKEKWLWGYDAVHRGVVGTTERLQWGKRRYGPAATKGRNFHSRPSNSH